MRQNQSDDQLQTEDLLGGTRGRDTDHPGSAHPDPERNAPEYTGAAEHTDRGHTDTPDPDRTDPDAFDRDAVHESPRPATADDRYGEPVEADVTTPDSTTPEAADPYRGPTDADLYTGPAEVTTPADTTPTAAIPVQQEHRAAGVPVATDAEEPGADLFSDDEVERFRAQWSGIQGTFVDDPRDAVRNADHLVAEVMQALAATFTEHKRGLEEQWQSGADAQTEELRQALRRYRAFFNQLLHS
ncbi:hypothetical protein [Actinokineospora enzanensis]|uniref:hypothetical protein n=1 Tax=Actinokineospora enzanensis TaxID=155975 RepID=UPI00036032F6|nr:hypothetical protein [Actinokineospora enzanensis]